MKLSKKLYVKTIETMDPMERIVSDALKAAQYRFVSDFGGGNPSNLDFRLIDSGVEIEIKRFHTSRISEQMSRAENVIAVQGEAAVRLFASLIRQSRP